MSNMEQIWLWTENSGADPQESGNGSSVLEGLAHEITGFLPVPDTLDRPV